MRFPTRTARLPLKALLLLLAGCADVRTGKDAYVAQDYPAALHHFSELSARGFPDARTRLGEMYMTGNGVPADHKKAVALFSAAALEENYPPAWSALGEAYHHGLGVPRDHVKAKKHFEQAIALGYTGARLPLGDLLRDLGQRDKARDIYKQALAEGHTTAYYRLAALYRDRDPAMALYWYYIARKMKVDGAAERAETLEKRLQPEQLARALRLFGNPRP